MIRKICILLTAFVAVGAGNAERSHAVTGKTTGKAASKAVHATQARTSIEKVLQNSYAAIERGDIEGWAAAFAPDVFMFGSGAEEALVGKPAAIADIHKVFDPAIKAGAKFQAKAIHLQLVVAPDGKEAWVADSLDFRILMGAETTPMPFRITTVLMSKDGAWQIVATHYSHSLSNEAAFQLAGEGKLPKPTPIAESIAPGAQGLLDLFTKTAGSAGDFINSFSDSPDAFAFGTAPGEAILGGIQVKAAFTQQGQAYNLQTARNGGARVGISANGKVGWIASNIDYTATINGAPTTQTYRALLVYLNEEKGWRIVQVHFSNGLPDAQ